MRLRVVATAVLAGSLFLAWPSFASDGTEAVPVAEPDGGSETQQPGATPRELQSARRSVPPPPTYQLPKVGKPKRRVGGGRRGPMDDLPSLIALAPDHVGLTGSASPTLLGYTDKELPGKLQVKLVLIDARSIEPLVDTVIDAPPNRGFQRIRLADYGMELAIGEEYQWSIELVVDPERPSRDVVATAWVERVEPPDELALELAAAGPDGSVATYAAAGLWYDALAASLDLAERESMDPGFQGPLRALLSQANLELTPEPTGAP
jgi:hypothetical protein